MTELGKAKLNVRRRFEFIEFQLSWEGRIGRKELQDQFDMSPQQATKDLSVYIDAYPDNILYDPRAKAYVPSASFKPKLISGTVADYLLHLDMLSQGSRDQKEIWPKNLPEYDAVAVHSRPIDPKSFKLILSAIRQKVCLEARYVSLSSDASEFRTLFPHAFASDGHRWHLRAYDFEKERYSDFVLSRLEVRKKTTSPGIALPNDEPWQKYVPLELMADPLLSDVQKDRLELEYGMEGGHVKLEVRQALLFYYLRYFGFNPFDIEDGSIRNISSFHLKIRNIGEVETCLGRRK